MSDEPNEFAGLEAELRQLVPGVPAGNLEGRVERALAVVPTGLWADRCLMGAIGMGLAASIVVAATLGSDLVQARTEQQPEATSARATLAIQTREYLAMLALGHETVPPSTATAPNSN